MVDDVKICVLYSIIIVWFIYDNLSFVVMVGVLMGLSLILGIINVLVLMGNLGLVLFELDNIDVLVEWYYSDVSYVFVGYYNKKVDNFIGLILMI